CLYNILTSTIWAFHFPSPQIENENMFINITKCVENPTRVKFIYNHTYIFMGKGAITFLSIFLFLISFFIFIKIFPEGIKIAPSTKIEIEGEMILFGDIRGEVNRIYSKNFSILYNEIENKGEEIYIEGNISFNCKILAISDSLATNETYFHGKNCIISNKEKKFYETIDGKIEGNIFIYPYGIIYLNESENEIEINSSLPFKLKNFVFSKNGRFFIDKEKNFSFIAFTGIGEYKNEEKKFYGEAKIIFIDNKFYEKFSYKWLIYIWIASVIIFIPSLFFKREQIEKDKNYLGFSIVSSIFFFCISIFLWNCEIKRIVGLNIFDLKNFLKFSFSLILYLFSFAMIGFPIRIAISSFFEFFGIVNIGRAIARSIGFLMIFILGIIFLPFLMNITLSPFLKYYLMGLK
ncbi:MAG: hypothetical protein QW519_04920, partial [Candidatus Thermoplasmatota archaeon]